MQLYYDDYLLSNNVFFFLLWPLADYDYYYTVLIVNASYDHATDWTPANELSVPLLAAYNRRQLEYIYNLYIARSI